MRYLIRCEPAADQPFEASSDAKAIGIAIRVMSSRPGLARPPSQLWAGNRLVASIEPQPYKPQLRSLDSGRKGELEARLSVLCRHGGGVHGMPQELRSAEVPSARICCCFSLSKTLLIPALEHQLLAGVNVSAA